MPEYNFLQLDVFTDRAFCGNPLAVFPEAEGIPDDLMGKIAREMNLSETVFVLKPESEKALRRLRIFTPMREIPFAGHPIVGTWAALASNDVVPLPDGGNGWQHIFHEVGIGVLPLDIEFKDGKPVQVVMTQGRFEVISDRSPGVRNNLNTAVIPKLNHSVVFAASDRERATNVLFTPKPNTCFDDRKVLGRIAIRTRHA